MHLRYREMNYILMVHLGKPLQMEKTHHLWNCGYIFLKYDHVSALNYFLCSTSMRWSLISKVKLESIGTRPDRSLHFVIMGKMLYVICVIEVFTYYLLGWWWVFGWYLVISVSFLIPFLLLLWFVIRYFYDAPWSYQNMILPFYNFNPFFLLSMIERNLTPPCLRVYYMLYLQYV